MTLSPVLLINKIKDSPALRGSIIVSAGLFTGSVFSYLLQTVMGRLLTVSDYGIFNSLLSLYTLFGVFATALSTSLIKMVASMLARKEFDKMTKLFSRLTVYMFILGVSLFMLVALFSGQISNYLVINDRSLIIVFGVFLGISFQNIIPSSYLQGLLRFKAFAFWNVTYHFLRFAIPALFVYLGFKVGSVFLGIAAAVLLSLVLSIFLLKKNFTDYGDLDLNSQLRKILSFMAPVLLINIGMVALNNVDVVLVKHYFDPESAGLYSGLVTIGKVLIFGAGTIGVVMFPQISNAVADGRNYYKKFNSFLMLQLLLVVAGVSVFSIFPGLIVNLMFGEKFLVSSPLLPKYALFAGIFVLINFMILFFLAIEKTRIFFFMIPAVIGQVFSIILWHEKLTQIININLIVSVLLFASILIYYGLNVRIYHSTRLQTRENH